MADAVGHIEFLFRGGLMMYPLLLSGFCALVVVIERLWLLNSRLSGSKAETKVILNLARAGKLTEAATQSAASTSPVVNVIHAGLKDLGAPVEEAELSMQNEAEMWVPVLEKRLGILDTVITAAPLMGLLGTITGMMASFQVLSEKGVNEPNAITGGVSEALIATATGLVIALLTLVAFNYLNQRVKDLIFEMERAGAEIIEARKRSLRKMT